ncbi:MAG: prepilin peptidase [candidate division Zixibacteria bacterium]|nr:prepilin peptidase [candidate division Zixibacteria bacterium]
MIILEYVPMAVVFALGLIFGSFANVVIYRLPRRLSIIRPRSFCPACQKTIPWWGNIPLFSYIFLRARCVFCRSPISPRYFFVELFMAVLFLAAYLTVGWSWKLLFLFYLNFALVAIFFIDMEFRIIPDWFTLPGILFGLAYAFLNPEVGWRDGLIGLAAGGGGLLLLAYLGEFFFKKESMGGGDVKMAAMLGGFLGWQKLVLLFFLASLTAVLTFFAIRLFRPKALADRLIPFGPFLVFAALVAYFWGGRLISLYTERFLAIR